MFGGATLRDDPEETPALSGICSLLIVGNFGMTQQEPLSGPCQEREGLHRSKL